MSKINQSSYRQIMKATSLFGGVQFINILIQIIRSKIIAVLLGPTGIGILGLLNSTITMVKCGTDFGLGVSAVKDIALANESENNLKVSETVTIVRRLVWLTGTLGTLVVFFFSSWLSQVTFGNDDFTIAFIWISITLLFQQLTTGQFVILQGLRKLNLLAKANVLGSALALIFTVPLYYLYGLDGIVPGIIGTSLISLIVAWYYSKKIFVNFFSISYRQTFLGGKKILKMGFMISLSSLLVIGSSYLLRIFINKIGGIEQVGLYDAGFMIINTYVGLIFTAMSTDYFPRLSAVSESNNQCRQTINYQAEIAILILAPILIIFLIFIKEIIVILYSNQFVSIDKMIYWAAIGMFFKTATWAIGYILLAKSNSKVFFISELVTNIYTLAFNILGYYYYGLEGLGISFLISYVLSLIQVFLIAKIKYDFSFNNPFLKIFIIQFTMAILSFLLIYFVENSYLYFFGIILICLSSLFSYKELDYRIDFVQLFNKGNEK